MNRQYGITMNLFTQVFSKVFIMEIHFGMIVLFFCSPFPLASALRLVGISTGVHIMDSIV